MTIESSRVRVCCVYACRGLLRLHVREWCSGCDGKSYRNVIGDCWMINDFISIMSELRATRAGEGRKHMRLPMPPRKHTRLLGRVGFKTAFKHKPFKKAFQRKPASGLQSTWSYGPDSCDWIGTEFCSVLCSIHRPPSRGATRPLRPEARGPSLQCWLRPEARGPTLKPKVNNGIA